MNGNQKSLISIRQLQKFFERNKGMFQHKREYVRAVDGVDLDIYQGETLGLVGESGCGKSTIGQLLLNLEKPTAGTVQYDGKEIHIKKSSEIKKIRRDMQIIFQDPFASLNPRKTIATLLEEPLIIHGIGSSVERKQRVEELIESVELPKSILRNYPHEFSGGQRQRICIARALALNPKFIVCDEATSALDVSVQAQILNLLVKLQADMDLTYLFISHNLNVIESICDRVAVMYLGRIMEIATAEDLLKDTVHPYTVALLSANPDPDPFKKKEKVILTGEIPSPINPPSGCHFHPRCPKKMDICEKEIPDMYSVGEQHCIRCFLFDQEHLSSETV